MNVYDTELSSEEDWAKISLQDFSKISPADVRDYMKGNYFKLLLPNYWITRCTSFFTWLHRIAHRILCKRSFSLYCVYTSHFLHKRFRKASCLDFYLWSYNLSVSPKTRASLFTLSFIFSCCLIHTHSPSKCIKLESKYVLMCCSSLQTATLKTRDIHKLVNYFWRCVIKWLVCR